MLIYFFAFSFFSFLYKPKYNINLYSNLSRFILGRNFRHKDRVYRRRHLFAVFYGADNVCEMVFKEFT